LEDLVNKPTLPLLDDRGGVVVVIPVVNSVAVVVDIVPPKLKDRRKNETYDVSKGMYRIGISMKEQLIH